MRKPIIGLVGLVGLLALAALTACADRPPSAQTQAEEVARLEAKVVPVVAELKVGFYLDEGASCHSILYEQGEFRDGDDSCGSPTENYGPFDARVRTDFDRIKAAMDGSEVPTYRFDASFTGDGVLSNISLPRKDSSWQWNWSYLYDPNGSVEKKTSAGEPTLGHPNYTKISENWWLVTAVDD